VFVPKLRIARKDEGKSSRHGTPTPATAPSSAPKHMPVLPFSSDHAGVTCDSWAVVISARTPCLTHGQPLYRGSGHVLAHFRPKEVLRRLSPVCRRPTVTMRRAQAAHHARSSSTARPPPVAGYRPVSKSRQSRPLDKTSGLWNPSPAAAGSIISTGLLAVTAEAAKRDRHAETCGRGQGEMIPDRP